MERNSFETNTGLTARFLELQAEETANAHALETYNTLTDAILRHPYTRFITFTFEAPVTDLIGVYSANRGFRQHLTRRLFGRSRSGMHFLFVAERHRHGGYHVHLLMSEPIGCRTLDRHGNLNVLIEKTAAKICADWQGGRKRIGRTDIRPIDDKYRLVDYLLKGLKRNELEVDYYNSTLWS